MKALPIPFGEDIVLGCSNNLVPLETIPIAAFRLPFGGEAHI